MENKFEIGDSIMIVGDIASKYAVGIIEDIIPNGTWENRTYEYRVRVWWNGAIVIFNADEEDLDYADQENTMTQLQLGLVWQDQRIDELYKLLEERGE